VAVNVNHLHREHHQTHGFTVTYHKYTARYVVATETISLNEATSIADVLKEKPARACPKFSALKLGGELVPAEKRSDMITADATLTCGPTSFMPPTLTEFCDDTTRNLGVCGGTNTWILDKLCRPATPTNVLHRYVNAYEALNQDEDNNGFSSCTDLLTAFATPGLYQVDISLDRAVDKQVSFLHEFTVDVKSSTQRVLVQGYTKGFNAFWWVNSAEVKPLLGKGGVEMLGSSPLLTFRTSFGSGTGISDTNWNLFLGNLKAFCEAGTYGNTFTAQNQHKSDLWDALPFLPGATNVDGPSENIVFWIRKFTDCPGTVGTNLLKALGVSSPAVTTADHPSLAMVQAAWDVCSPRRTEMNKKLQ